ncbi:hypothetical protein NDU88_005661 [Pleurodeles waltl]|uniref:Uncharacterized protein n=1 Tax=Pleurodeles waltl TaxID=8319 RepID=A0AAV7SMC4_PLEWA|nr:hypothetical protein NDU88_005661 [Pleurodeles waltl]
MEGSRVARPLAWGIILISSVGSTIVFGSPISGMQEPGEGLRRILHLRSGIGESACFLQINNHGRVDAVPRQTIYSKYVGPEYEPRHEGYAQEPAARFLQFSANDYHFANLLLIAFLLTEDP